MNGKNYSLILLLCVSCCSFADSNGVMFHCQINKEWIDMFIDAKGVTHYEHRKTT